ncbi:hypothetical protein GCM10007315_27220 [Gemmobacter tilapiae]|uniref:Uncharacterized protein n=1 Tax=Neogemmobacter tilapiae TaxID=875041 RepID=A0A918TTV4_9RHOB|nr:hypothetical protein GCM10007315_27220 [Gemmobacter tilapiae]
MTGQTYEFKQFTELDSREPLFVWAAEKDSMQQLWGLMRIEDGSWVVEPQFDSVDRAIFGRAFARLPDDGASGKRSNLIAFVSVSGEVTYEERLKGLTCPDGSRVFKENDLWGIRGADGNVLIPAIHRALSCYRKGIVWLPVADDRQWCPHGPDGQRRERPACRDAYNLCEGSWSHLGPEVLDEDAFESSILWTRTLLEVLDDPNRKGPNLVGDGVMGGTGKHEIRSWDCYFVDN